jgi:hypothetical protein
VIVLLLTMESSSSGSWQLTATQPARLFSSVSNGLRQPTRPSPQLVLQQLQQRAPRSSNFLSHLVSNGPFFNFLVHSFQSFPLFYFSCSLLPAAAVGFRKPHLPFRFPAPILKYLPPQAETDVAAHPTLDASVPPIAHHDASPQVELQIYSTTLWIRSTTLDPAFYPPYHQP